MARTLNGPLVVAGGSAANVVCVRSQRTNTSFRSLSVWKQEVVLRAWALTIAAFAAAAGTTLVATSARANQCGDSAEGFDEWLSGFRQVAINDGVSPQVIGLALTGVAYDPSVLAHDHEQGFHVSFAPFAAQHVTPGRIKRGKTMLLAYAEPFEKIEQRYGVPAPVLVAIWGLETDFGAGNGTFPTFSALATLAYNCRRAERYRAELIDALMIVQRGLLDPSQMRGAWAGEIGQTQFMPSAYLKFAVTVDGGAGADLIHNSADALASTANFLRAHGWQPGAGWDEGQPNFAALLEWNSAPVYAKTIALFADKLAGQEK
jgi:lytic murein transglycosylase